MSINQILKERTSTMQTSAIRDYLEERVDLRTGKMVLDHTDFELSGELMPVSIHHVYNSALSDVFYTSDADERIADFSGMKLGYGWRLNIMQSMTSASVTYDGETYNGFTYVDGDGNITEFIPADNVNEFKAVNDDEAIYNSLSGVLTLGGYAYKFANNRLVRIKKIDAENTVAVRIVYAEGRIISVVDGAGRTFRFDYDADGFLDSIIAPDMSKIDFGYVDANSTLNENAKTLNYIRRYKTSVNENNDVSYSYLNMSYFLYDTEEYFHRILSCGYCEDIGTYALIRKDYSYDNNHQLCGNELVYDIVDDESYTMGTKYLYCFTDDYTMVALAVKTGATYKWASTYYVFDNKGNIVSEYVDLDGEKYEVSTGCQPINLYDDNSLNIIISSENLLSNHSFTRVTTDENGNSVVDNWIDTDSEYVPASSICDDESKAMYGRKSLSLVSSDVENGATGYMQSIKLNKGSYVFSAYAKILNEFKVDGIMAEANPGIFLQALINGNDFSDVSETVNERSAGFVHMSISFTVATDNTIVDLAILSNGKGVAYVSCPMLEKGNTVGGYNLLETNSVDNWELTEESNEIEYTDSVGFNTNGSIELCQPSCIKQTVYPKKSASILESYVLSAWMKAEKSFETEAIYTMSLKAVINYSNGETEEFTQDFYTLFDIWQKCEVHIEKSKCLPVESIDVYCDYTGFLFTVYLDNLELYREDIVTGFTGESIDEEGYTSTDADTSTAAGDFDEIVDANGNPLTSTTFFDGCFGTFYRSYAYSENGNDRITETDTRGNSTRYGVDTLTSRITSVTDRLGNITEYEYNENGKVSKVIHKDADGNACSYVEYSYDYNGNVTNITRGDGKEYAFAYNNLGLLVNALDGTVTYNYRANSGRLKSMTYANGSTVNLTYDSIGRLIHEVWTKNDTVEADYRYTYDREGNVISTIDKMSCKEYNYYYKDGNVIRASVNSLVFDEQNGEDIVSRESVCSIRYTYDENGQIKKKEYPASGLKVYYRYGDNTDTVTKYLYENSVAEYHSATDHLGRRTVEEIRTGKYLHYRKFDYLQGEITPTHTDNGKAISHPETNLVSKLYLPDRTLSYTYDEEERIITHKDYQGYTNEYTYDTQGQLIRHVVKLNATDKIDNALSVTYYEYDNYGNILAKGSVLGSDGKLDRTSASNCVYTYDTEDNDKLVSYTNGTGTFNMAYDRVGNPTSYKGSTLVWEKGRQLKKYGKHCFEYNSDGIRTARYFNTNVNGQTVQVRYDYELEGTKLVRMIYRDRNGKSNDIIPLYDTSETPIGIIHSYIDDDGNKITRRYWYAKNLQGDILALRDDTGADVVRYVYDAWGKVTVGRDNSGVDLADINPFRYRGYLYDYEFGLYYLQSRYYDPELCRFVNADEAAYLGASGTNLGYNLFAYCENDPITNIDPDGHLVITTTMLICAGIGALVLGTVGGFAGYYISKKMNIPKGSRWKYVVGGTIIGAVVGAVAGFGLGYCIGGGSVVAVVGKSGTAISTKALKLGNKLHYVFGKATGSAHNIKRSQSMYSLLKKIGIWDNKFGNEYLTKCIIEIYKNATPYASKGKLVREAMLYGPGGGVMLKTIWEGTKLITVYIFG